MACVCSLFKNPLVKEITHVSSAFQDSLVFFSREVASSASPPHLFVLVPSELGDPKRPGEQRQPGPLWGPVPHHLRQEVCHQGGVERGRSGDAQHLKEVPSGTVSLELWERR